MTNKTSLDDKISQKRFLPTESKGKISTEITDCLDAEITLFCLCHNFRKRYKRKSQHIQNKKKLFLIEYVAHPWDSLPQEIASASRFRKCAQYIPQYVVGREEFGIVV